MPILMNKSDKRHQKERLYQLFTQVTQALANPRRLELVDLLGQAPRTVEELAQETQMSIANTSQHLQRLKRAHSVRAEREGVHIRYYLSDPVVARLWLELRMVAEHQLAEVEDALTDYRPRRHAFSTLSFAELQMQLQAGEVLLLDVRPTVEYQAGHLPHAISMPLAELNHRLVELPIDKLIVAYCRGPYCVYADEALDVLAAQGWRVARLEEGVLEWQLLADRQA